MIVNIYIVGSSPYSDPYYVITTTLDITEVKMVMLDYKS
jgi:hypothetical protein